MDGGGGYYSAGNGGMNEYNLEGQIIINEDVSGSIRRPPPTGALKTKLCTKFMATGACPYGMSCNFAHGEQDLRASSYFMDPEIIAARKQRLCNKHSTPAGCPYGDRCNFAHGPKELVGPPPGVDPSMRDGPTMPHVTTYTPGAPPVDQQGAPGYAHPFNFKTKLCNKWQAGTCPFGSKCHFAHGHSEMRDRQPLPGGDVPGAPKGDWQEMLKYIKSGPTATPTTVPPPPAAVLAAVAQKLADGEYAYRANPYGDYFEEGDEDDMYVEEEMEPAHMLVDSQTAEGAAKEVGAGIPMSMEAAMSRQGSVMIS